MEIQKDALLTTEPHAETILVDLFIVKLSANLTAAMKNVIKEINAQEDIQQESVTNGGVESVISILKCVNLGILKFYKMIKKESSKEKDPLIILQQINKKIQSWTVPMMTQEMIFYAKVYPISTES